MDIFQNKDRSGAGGVGQGLPRRAVRRAAQRSRPLAGPAAACLPLRATCMPIPCQKVLRACTTPPPYTTAPLWLLLCGYQNGAVPTNGAGSTKFVIHRIEVIDSQGALEAAPGIGPGKAGHTASAPRLPFCTLAAALAPGAWHVLHSMMCMFRPAPSVADG